MCYFRRMEKKAIMLKLDAYLISKLDQEVGESNGVYTSRTHLIRCLIARSYPPKNGRVTLAKPIPPPAGVDADTLARLEVQVRRDMGLPADGPIRD